MLGSARETPWHGQVKFVPSMRNVFSFTADPNAETVLTVPLDGDVGEIPGAFFRKSNMLKRRVGVVAMSSASKRVWMPLCQLSVRAVASTVMAVAMPDKFNTTVRSIRAPVPMVMPSSRCAANFGASSTVNVYDPGGSTGNRHWPLSPAMV